MIKCSCGAILEIPNKKGIYTAACILCGEKVISVANFSGRITYFRDNNNYPIMYVPALFLEPKTIKGVLTGDYIFCDNNESYRIQNNFNNGLHAYFTIKRVRGNIYRILEDYPL